MAAKLYTTQNPAHRFGEANSYLSARLKWDGVVCDMFFTEVEIERAIKRGVRQPELAKSLEEKIRPRRWWERWG